MQRSRWVRFISGTGTGISATTFRVQLHQRTRTNGERSRRARHRRPRNMSDTSQRQHRTSIEPDDQQQAENHSSAGAARNREHNRAATSMRTTAMMAGQRGCAARFGWLVRFFRRIGQVVRSVGWLVGYRWSVRPASVVVLVVVGEAESVESGHPNVLECVWRAHSWTPNGCRKRQAT